MPRQVDGNLYAKRNQEDHFNKGFGMREHTNNARSERFANRHIGDPDLRTSVKITSQKKTESGGGNILTWDQPYNSKTFYIQD